MAQGGSEEAQQGPEQGKGPELGQIQEANKEWTQEKLEKSVEKKQQEIAE